MKMNEEKLKELLCIWANEGDVAALPFEDAGVFSYNNGVVLSFDDGSEFQITIVQSK
jgi:hypothetical protein